MDVALIIGKCRQSDDNVSGTAEVVSCEDRVVLTVVQDMIMYHTESSFLALLNSSCPGASDCNTQSSSSDGVYAVVSFDVDIFLCFVGFRLRWL